MTEASERRAIAAMKQGLVYLLKQLVVRPESYSTGQGRRRGARDMDGNLREVARQTGLSPEGVRYIVNKVEERREMDRELDEMLTRLEDAFFNR